jgi:hypothetical protein
VQSLSSFPFDLVQFSLFVSLASLLSKTPSSALCSLVQVCAPAAILLRLSFGSGGVYLLRLVSVQHLCASGKIDAGIFLVVPRSFLFVSSCVCSYRSFAALLVESHRRDATATLPAAAHRCRACSLEQRLFLICWSSVSYSLSSSSCSVSCCDCSFPVLA